MGPAIQSYTKVNSLSPQPVFVGTSLRGVESANEGVLAKVDALAIMVQSRRGSARAIDRVLGVFWRVERLYFASAQKGEVVEDGKQQTIMKEVNRARRGNALQHCGQ